MTGSSQKIKYSVNSELISVSGRVYGEPVRRQQTNLAFKNVITCLRVPLYLLRVEQGCLELIFIHKYVRSMKTRRGAIM